MVSMLVVGTESAYCITHTTYKLHLLNSKAAKVILRVGDMFSSPDLLEWHSAGDESSDDDESYSVYAPSIESDSFFDFLLKYGFELINRYSSIGGRDDVRAEQRIRVLAVMMESKFIDIETKDIYDHTPLLRAVEMGDSFACRTLIQLGANVNQNCRLNDVPLIVAASTGNSEILSLLLENGANIDARNSFGSSPFLVACMCMHVEEATMLLEHRANAAIKNYAGETALMFLARGNCFDLMDRVIQLGVNVNSQNNRGETALFYATYGRNSHSFAHLVHRGADLNIRDRYGNDAVTMAIENIFDSTFYERIDQLPNVYEFIEKNRAIIFSAVRRCNDVALKFLIRNGAVVNQFSRNGRSPLWEAVALGLDNHVEILLRNGADIDKPCAKSGLTPLMIGLKRRKKNVCRILLQCGADVTAPVGRENSPLDLAIRNEWADIAEIISPTC